MGPQGLGPPPLHRGLELFARNVPLERHPNTYFNGTVYVDLLIYVWRCAQALCLRSVELCAIIPCHSCCGAHTVTGGSAALISHCFTYIEL